MPPTIFPKFVNSVWRNIERVKIFVDEVKFIQRINFIFEHRIRKNGARKKIYQIEFAGKTMRRLRQTNEMATTLAKGLGRSKILFGKMSKK